MYEKKNEEEEEKNVHLENNIAYEDMKIYPLLRFRYRTQEIMMKRC
jgi:hypothetical protein